MPGCPKLHSHRPSLLLLLLPACPQPPAPVAPPPPAAADAGLETCTSDDDCVLVPTCCRYEIHTRRAAPPPPECPRPLVCPGDAWRSPDAGACREVFVPSGAPPADRACASDDDCAVVHLCCGATVGNPTMRPRVDCAAVECPEVAWPAPQRALCRKGWCLGL